MPHQHLGIKAGKKGTKVSTKTLLHRGSLYQNTSDFNTINEPEHEHRWTIHLQASLNIYIEEQQTVHGHYFGN